MESKPDTQLKHEVWYVRTPQVAMDSLIDKSRFEHQENSISSKISFRNQR